MILTILVLFVSALGFFLGITFHKKKLKAAFDVAQQDSEQILLEAQKERDKIIRQANQEAKQENRQRRQQLEADMKKRRQEISKLESKINNREQSLDKKLSILDTKEADLEKMSSLLQKEEQHYKKMIETQETLIESTRKKLETIANLSQEEAKRKLMASMESEARIASQDTIKQIEEDARTEGFKRAQSMVSLAVQRVSSEYVNDSTITVVALPNDEMKGRIIGREGRNIRALEQATGVDLIIDDTPEAVILSCFNPIRREIAKLSLEKLIADGRIHPARIEETVKKVTSDFHLSMRENGEQAAFDAGISDLHPELLDYLGKLKHRTIGQQTVLHHSVEVAHICAIMAGEMGINVKIAKRCGLLHDIGKAVDQEIEGDHASIGADLCKKFKERSEIIEAIRDHHAEDLSYAKPLTVILHASNILSENRPGARKEILETYVKRLDKMESLVNNFKGIENSFVIQAGREIRAIVNPDGITDDGVVNLSHDIASTLRKELSFPGQVKVTVLRESKFTEFAK